MSERPRDRAAWPTATVAAWLIASAGLVAVTTAGPIFRPGVQASPADVAIAMIVGLAVGWPLLMASGRAVAVVGGQGAIVLAIDATGHDRTNIDVSVAMTAWLVAIGLGGALSAFARSRLAWVERTWAAILLAVTVVVLLRLT